MNDAPKRTAPATILVSVARNAPQTILGIPALYAVTSREGIGVVLAIMAATAVLSLGYAWLRWRNFTYRIGSDELVIQQGVFTRSRRSIPLERIQDVSIEQGPIPRLFGLALVKIETGGGTKDEGKLDSVTLAEAHRLRATLRGEARPAFSPDTAVDTPHADADVETEGEHPIFAMSLGRVLYAGLFNFSLIWVAAIFGVLQTIDDLIDWKRLVATLGQQVETHRDIGSVATLVALTLLLGVFAGLARTLGRDFGFRLMHAKGRFRRVRGLLTRSEVVIADRRIQLAIVRRGALSGWLGWYQLQFQTLGGSDDKGGLQQVAPFARMDEVEPVIAAAGIPPFEQPEMKPVSSGHIIRAAIRHATPLALGALIAGIFIPPFLLALVLLPVPIGLALLRRRYHRYALRDSSFQVMRGVLVRDMWIVPYSSVQSVTVRRGPLQRLLGIASVHVDTAGASGFRQPNVSDAGQGDVVALARGLAARA